MARTYEEEKAYCERRAQALVSEMDAALASNDAERFKAAYESSQRYLTKKQRMPLYIRFLERRTQKP